MRDIDKKAPQKVTARIEFSDPTWPPVEKEIDGVTAGNIRTKLSTALSTLLLQYVTTEGAKITLTIDPAKADEFANPDR